MGVGEPGALLGQGEGRALGLGEHGRLRGVHVGAEPAAVDLAGAQRPQLDGRGRQRGPGESGIHHLVLSALVFRVVVRTVMGRRRPGRMVEPSGREVPACRYEGTLRYTGTPRYTGTLRRSSGTAACCSPSPTRCSVRPPTPRTWCRRRGCAGPVWTSRRCATGGVPGPDHHPPGAHPAAHARPPPGDLCRLLAARAAADHRRRGRCRGARGERLHGDAAGAGVPRADRAGGVRAARGVRPRPRRDRRRGRSHRHRRPPGRAPGAGARRGPPAARDGLDRRDPVRDRGLPARGGDR